ncbi:hypothetical protein AYO20_09754 [Fonsecaea nubica]|uniref:DUF4238 domain-containing protein n=1 Tax=Fonsecaea nubica TaxID=856822 RepID=A0A178CFH8_9EURO|nr:hypothetical protein AYO20_09754 [Fonsecaea nubica]OAL27471.1 hypothetical protein AYO20_09754 [Fonsecaea nubica]
MSSQYQHFIPQFILRKFSNFETLVAEGLQRTKARKYCKVSFLNLEDGKLESRKAARTFGRNNMYLDPSIFPASSVAECMVEKELCTLEERAAKILQKIETAYHCGDSQFSLRRHEKDELRRFLFIMLYRNRSFERRFEKSKKDYDADDRYNMLIYMQERGIEDPKTVWLNNLLAFLSVPLGTKEGWKREIIEKAYPPDAAWFIMHLESTFLSFCCPANLPYSDNEFMLTQNAYSIFEGPNDETQWTDWHVFAPISPNLMIIMRKNVLQRWDDPDKERMRLEQLEVIKSEIGLDRIKPQRLSNLIDLPLERPQVRYFGSPVEGEPVSQFCKDDEFNFKFIRVSTEHLQLLNTIFFEEAITTSGIVFNDRQKFKHMLEHYLAADPLEFKQTYSNDQLLKCHSPLPSPWLGLDAWRKANVPAYLKLLEAAAAELGSDVRAQYFDWNFFKCFDGISSEFIRRYSRLGGDGCTILYDLSQANSITNLVTRVDRLIQSQPQSFKAHVRQERAKLLTQLPARRLWLHMRQLRTRIRSKSINKPEDELEECTTSKADGLEDAMIDGTHSNSYDGSNPFKDLVTDSSFLKHITYSTLLGSQK